MGMKTMDEMVTRLIDCGHASNTPVAVVQWATRQEQRTITGVLGSIAERCAEEGIESPAIIIVGAVVGLREQFKWFEE